MTLTEIWVHLLAAFAIGLGLGWWLWGGRRDPASGSAAEACQRALPTHGSDDRKARDERVAELEGAVAQLQDAVRAAKAAEEAALRQRSRAVRDAETERGRAEHLRGQLHETRHAHDTLKGEVVQAQETIAALSPASAPDQSAAQTENLSAPGAATDSFQLQTFLPSSENAPQEAPAPSPAPAATTAASPRIVAPPPPRRKLKGPIDVLFGPLSGVPLTPNARSIPWELTLRMRDLENCPGLVTDIEVTLRFDLEDEGIAVNGRRRGPLTLHKGGTVTQTRPLLLPVSLSTGFHSDTAEANRPPAVPGDHRLVIVVHYRTDLAPETRDRSRFAARIPVLPAS